MTDNHKHTWIVANKAILRHLLLSCDCGAQAHVDDPTNNEWGRAFFALTHPFPWQGGEHRVKGVQDERGGIDQKD